MRNPPLDAGIPVEPFQTGATVSGEFVIVFLSKKLLKYLTSITTAMLY